MKVLKAILLCCGLFHLSQEAIVSNIALQSVALSQMIDIFKEKYYIEINILIWRKSQKWKNFELLAEKILHLTKYPSEIQIIDDYKKIFNKPLKSYLILSDSCLFTPEIDASEFENLIFNQTKSYKNFKRLALIQYGVKNRIFNVFNSYGYYIFLQTKYHVSEIYFDDKTGSFIFSNIFLPSFYLCDNESRWTIKFAIAKKSWVSSSFLQTNNEFRKCVIRVYFYEVQFPFFKYLISYEKVGKRTDGYVKYRVSSYLGDIVNLFADKREIEIEFYMEHIINEIHITQFIMNEEDSVYHGYLTFPITFFRFTFIATRGLPYSPFEKLYLPFDTPTWTAVFTTFVLGYLSIFIIYQCPLENQNFVFGLDNRTPSFNMIQIFFGIGLARVPGRNFARFHAMIFTLFCLIIRTAYQGTMYKIMTTDLRKPSVETYQDILDQNVVAKVGCVEDKNFFKL